MLSGATVPTSGALLLIMPSAEHLPRVIWAEPRWLQFLEWEITPDLVQATWEWPRFLSSKTKEEVQRTVDYLDQLV